MRTIKVERVEVLNDTQVLIMFPDETYEVVFHKHLLSVEQFHEIKKKQLQSNKKELKSLMNRLYLEVRDIYEILQDIDNEKL